MPPELSGPDALDCGARGRARGVAAARDMQRRQRSPSGGGGSGGSGNGGGAVGAGGRDVGAGDVSGGRPASVRRSDSQPPPAALRTREFPVSELIAVLEPLLRYPRVDWDARRLTWMAYNCTATGPGGGNGGGSGPLSGSPAAPGFGAAPGAAAPGPMVSEWVPAVCVELPRLAPRPPGSGFGDRAARRRAADGGGGEGWEARPGAWAGSGSSSSHSGSSKHLLMTYLDELGRASAARLGGSQRPDCYEMEGERRVSFGAAGSKGRGGAEDAEEGEGEEEAGGMWADLEVSADEEELRMLEAQEEHQQQQQQQQQQQRRLQQEEGTEAESSELAETGPEAAAAAAAAAGSASACAAAVPAVAAAAVVLPVDAALVLLSADSAALGVWLGGRLVRHKVLTGYTVRHSAGGSQARRDRRSGGGGGGGRSVGAALRRAEAARLWQATAARLADWAPDLAACRVLVRSGDTRVFAQLYEARRPPPPLDLRDPRWEGAGVSVPRPRLRDLLTVHRRLSTGRVEYLQGSDGAS
ncbi:hypothetical protein PLESTB_000155600 [Pleodorina starrii]|uniref:VLRF1 domain-containing protein n=1 Tax=Pleodorina starrii TaxID=330485 RepID=A0A9W6EXF0_9CHLO|nr:hypothetical protein PLESTB_000155600 [Pleodorina starrii]